MFSSFIYVSSQHFQYYHLRVIMSSMKTSKIPLVITHRFSQLWEQKQKREHRKISLLEISKITGLPYKTIYAWANDETTGTHVATHVVEALCRYFGVEVGDLLVLDE